jgi:drug/metabolite transporter (DMT)-like permease
MVFRTLSPMSLGVVLKLASTLFFTLMSVCLKLLGDHYPVAQLVFSRAFFALIPIVLWLGWRGDLISSFRTQRLSGHVVRAHIGIAAMFCTFAALTLLPLADVTALSYASPLMTVVLAALLLGEKVMIWRWSAVVVGFLGVLVMLWPHLREGTHLLDFSQANGPFLALAGALLAAMGCVSFVIIFDEDTPVELIRRLRPDIIVKGGDYDMRTLPETALVESWGGRAVAIPFEFARSTTALVTKIRQT